MNDDRFEDLCVRYRTPLVRDLMRFGRQRQEAEDIAHETLLKVWKHIHQVKLGSEWTYLRVAANRVAHNEHRRENAARRGGGVNVPLDSVEEAAANHKTESRAIARVDLERLQRTAAEVMYALSANTQLAIVLRHQGFSSAEIAKKVGLTATDVRSKLHRATELFRKRLGEPPAGVQWLDLIGELQ
jgi:RNA polymerase sigma factor (sigma-70 family)